MLKVTGLRMYINIYIHNIEYFANSYRIVRLISLRFGERMKTLYALCLVTLLAVLVDVVLFHSRTANAQNTGNYKVVPINDRGEWEEFFLNGNCRRFLVR